MSVSTERERLRLLTDYTVIRVVQSEARQDGLWLLTNFGCAFEGHMAVGLMTVIAIILIEDRLLPKVEAIDVTVAKIERALMGLEGAALRLAGYVVTDGESTGDDVA